MPGPFVVSPTNPSFINSPAEQPSYRVIHASDQELQTLRWKERAVHLMALASLLVTFLLGFVLVN